MYYSVDASRQKIYPWTKKNNHVAYVVLQRWFLSSFSKTCSTNVWCRGLLELGGPQARPEIK